MECGTERDGKNEELFSVCGVWGREGGMKNGKEHFLVYINKSEQDINCAATNSSA